MLEKMCEYKEKSKRKQSVSIICKVFKNIRSGKFNSTSNTIWSYYFKIFITLMSWVVSRMNCTMSWTRDANNGNCWFFIIFFCSFSFSFAYSGFSYILSLPFCIVVQCTCQISYCDRVFTYDVSDASSDTYSRMYNFAI